MIFRLVPFREIADFVAKNQLQHFTDASEISEHDTPNIDMDYYLMASDLGQCVAVIGEDDGICAYNVFFLSNKTNHKHIIEAVNSGIWVRKDKRGRGSYELVRQSEKLLFEIVKEINYNVPKDILGGFFGQLGYGSMYVTWSKKKHE